MRPFSISLHNNVILILSTPWAFDLIRKIDILLSAGIIKEKENVSLTEHAVEISLFILPYLA